MTILAVHPRLFLALGAGLLLLLFFYHPAPDASLSDLDRCFTHAADPAAKARCLRATAAQLLENRGAKELLAYATSPAAPSDLRNQCHAIAHIVGELAYEKYGSIESALAHCTPACRSGCTHGAIGAGILGLMGAEHRADDIAHADESTLKDLSVPYCAENNHACHAIGHAAYIALRDDVRALRLCDAATRDGFLREACYQGVFMERAGTFENVLFPSEDVAAPPTHPGDYAYPCSDLGAQYRHACFLFLNEFQGPLFVKDGIRTPAERLEKAVAVCASLRTRDRADCFTGIGTMAYLFGFSSLRSPDIEPLCSRFEHESDRSACTLGIIPRFAFIELRGLYDYCENIREEARRTLCYRGAFQWLETQYGIADDPARICGVFPLCSARYAAFMEERARIPDYRFGLYGALR